MLTLWQPWLSALWRARRWVDWLILECSLIRVWLYSLAFYLGLFPAALLIIHQAVLHRWIWEKGMLDSWSLSYTLVYGDSQLSIGAATATTMLIKAHRLGLRLWPSWMHHPMVVIAIGIAAGQLIGKWIFDVNGRPVNLETTHYYAWVYDVSHLSIATAVVMVLVYGGLAAWCWLWRKRLQPWMLPYLIVMLLVTIGYFGVAMADKQAIRFETGIQVSMPQRLELKLFGERPAGQSLGAMDEDEIEGLLAKPDQTEP